MHGSCKIALYMVLLKDVIYYYIWLVSAMLKMREHGCLHYYILFCGE